MRKTLKFLWIDDAPDRLAAAKTLEKRLAVKCHFIDLKNNASELQKVVTANIQPDLILIDHNLTNNNTNDIKKGSTIAAYLKEQWPSSPVACITGQSTDGIDFQQRSMYEEVFPFDQIAAAYPTIKAIAESYQIMRKNPPKSIKDILKLIKAPKSEYPRLETIVPHNVKSDFHDASLLPSISQWVRNTLIERPGFLYDRLWVATLLGIQEKSFKKVEHLFESAKYEGVFHNNSNERWWKAEVLAILAKETNQPGLPWVRGRHLQPITKADYSKDYYTSGKEDLPEVVAFTDDSSTRRVQIKLKYTIPHPKYDDLLFFDEIRMMKA